MGELARLIPPSQRNAVTNGVYRAVSKTFEEDHARAKSARLPPTPITMGETKRRFLIALNIFKQLRGDLHWGMKRALDFLPRYLRYELDGVKWTPDQRTVWAPGDG